MILDFFNENLPWRNSKFTKLKLLDSVKDDVKEVKLRCLKAPEKFLWT